MAESPRHRISLAIALCVACITTQAASAASSRPAATQSTTRSNRSTTPSKQASKAQRVTFATDEKTPVDIVGFYTPAPANARKRRAPMAILLHMYGEDHTGFDPLVPVLHAAGFAVLAIDLRGHGESVEPASLNLKQRMEDRDARLFRDMDNDVSAAYRWLAHRPDVDPTRFVIVGASVGASVALEYAASDRSVDGVVLMSPGSNYLGIDSLATVRKLKGTGEFLLLTSSAERHDADALSRPIEGSRVQVVTGSPDISADNKALHGTRMFGKVAGIEKTIADFLAHAAGPPSNDAVVASTKGEVYYEPGSSQADRLSPDNLRWFSSPAEAESRGYRPPKQRSKR